MRYNYNYSYQSGSEGYRVNTVIDLDETQHMRLYNNYNYAQAGVTGNCRPEILSRRQFFLGNSVAATIFPRRFCRSILTQRPHFLGNSVALLHRDTLPRSTAEFDIGGGTRGHWGPVPPLMSREEAASYIGNAVAALK